MNTNKLIWWITFLLMIIIVCSILVVAYSAIAYDWDWDTSFISILFYFVIGAITIMFADFIINEKRVEL